MTTTQKFFTLQEAAERWRLSDRTLRRWIDDGRLAAFRQGQRLMVTADEVAKIESEWAAQLDASRQAWNQRMAERKSIIE